MSNYVILNNTVHRDLRVITELGEAYGSNVMHAMTFPMEFRDVQSCYPILFCKDPESGQFYPTALFGFEKNQNLFLNEDGWDATYIPMMIKRHPFLIGFQADPDKGEDAKKPVVSIDMDNPRISETEGESVFTDSGDNSGYLKDSMARLEAIHRGHEHNKLFIEALLKNELLQSFTLEITLNNGSNNQLLGFYTIDEENLHKLKAEALALLHTKGFLQAIYMIMASFSRIRPMIDKKNALLP
jgi:hypothetical protein